MGTTAQKLAALAEVKADIADAITAKGGTVPTKFADYGDAIMALPGGGGTNKLPSVADKTVTSLSASDLAGATSIAASFFAGCLSLTSVEVPSSVTSMGNSTFSGCTGLTSVSIENGLRSMGTSVFGDCTALTSISLPDSVTYISGQPFVGCTSLALIDFGSTRSTIPTLSSDIGWSALPSDYRILVPSALLTSWKAASKWSSLSSHIFAHP